MGHPLLSYKEKIAFRRDRRESWRLFCRQFILDTRDVLICCGIDELDLSMPFWIQTKHSNS